jgi:negative regulator of sigma E activity
MDWRELIWFSGIIAAVSLAVAWLLSGRLKAWLTGRRALPDEQESPVVHQDPED